MKTIVILFALIGCALAAHVSSKDEVIAQLERWCLSELGDQLDELHLSEPINDYAHQIKADNPSLLAHSISYGKLAKYPPIPECQEFSRVLDRIMQETAVCSFLDTDRADRVLDQIVSSCRWELIMVAVRACNQPKMN